MGDVIPFGRKPSTKGNTLCKNGHHKWVVDTKSKFDVKEGKLATVYRCEKCGKTRHEYR